MSELQINRRLPAIRGSRHGRKSAARFLIAAAGLAALVAPAQAQKITSSIYADDEFKVFISTSATSPGVEFAQGAGWSINFQDHLYLYGGTKTYFLHVWVRDIGGGPTGFLGEFNLSNHRGCIFVNGTRQLLTEANPNWSVSLRQPLSTPFNGPIASVPYFTNAIPTFATATMVPADLGANAPGGNNWPSSPVAKPFNGVSSAAHWIGPRRGTGPEMWFTTRINCTAAFLAPGVNPN